MTVINNDAERTRRREYIAELRRENVEARAELQREIERQFFRGPEPPSWRERLPDPPPPPAVEQKLDTEITPFEAALEARIVELEERVEQVEDARVALLEAIAEETQSLIVAIGEQIDKCADRVYAKWGMAHQVMRADLAAMHIDLAELQQRFSEMCRLVAARGDGSRQEVLELPNPLPRRIN
jgi:hypothetical protein